MAKDRSSITSSVSALLNKLDDPDPDIRFMQLSDLATILSSSSSEFIKTENSTAARIIEGLLKSFSDGHGDIQNQALKCVGPLALRTPPEIVSPLLDKITDLTKTDIDLSIPNTALRILISSLPHPVLPQTLPEAHDAYKAISRVLIPRLVGRIVVPTSKGQPQIPSPGLLQKQKNSGYNVDAIDVMVEIVKWYGILLNELELEALKGAVMDIIGSPQATGVVKKRALAGVGALLVHFNTDQIKKFVAELGTSFESQAMTPIHRRFLVATVGTLARASPSKFGPHLKSLAPFVLQVVDPDELEAGPAGSDDENEVDPETEELRETALVALENLLASCRTEMTDFRTAATASSLRYLRYDPNVADLDEEMEGMDDTGSDDGVTDGQIDDDDDEFGDLDGDGAFSDVDDTSWKIRRCAAKVVYTIIASSSSADHSLLFDTVAPVLITRLNNEREDNVKLEIISALTALSRKISTTSISASTLANGSATISTPNARKRRREDSEVGHQDPELHGLIQSRSSPPILPASPPVGSQADFASLVPRIVQALNKFWKKASIPLKQASLIMLKTIALTRNGALADHLQRLEELISVALKPASSSNTGGATSGTSDTAAALQIDTLSLISTLTETNATTVLIPFVIASIPAVTEVVSDRNYKVVSETLFTLNQFVKALTPPRLPEPNQDHAIHIEKLYNVIMERVADNKADVEVRHRAIQALGVLLARTSSTSLLETSARIKALGVLHDRLKNETTRISSARAIGLIAEAAGPRDNIGGAWVKDVTLELAAQLRKADRALRGACLEALQYLALNTVTASQLDSITTQQLEEMLIPLLSATDLHLLTATLVILAKIVPMNAQILVNDNLVQGLCALTQTQLEGPALKAYLLVVKVIGESGVGAPLMKGLLQVGTSGDTIVLGRAIGTLLVFGGSHLNVSTSDFLQEIAANKSVQPVCLALTVLGETALRKGAASHLGVEVFTDSLTSKNDKVRMSAAVAFGSATSSNVKQFLPIILNNLSSGQEQSYVYLYSLKEVLQHPEAIASDLAPFAAELWQKLFDVSKVEDNRAIGAECIGRLATIDPELYVPELSKSLQSSEASTRGVVISAFRFTLTDTSNSFMTLLAKTITPMLETMLGDSDIDNRRLAVTTLNAAVHSKPELIVPDINRLLPLVLADSFIKSELIKTVKIGPFQHSEDTGLDLRKATYSTMYALLDTPSALPLLSIPVLFDRVQDGITDDQDIRTLCQLMLTRLTQIDPDETRRRLNPLSEKFKVVLATKVKENAVKQEIEKVNDANTAVIRTSLELDTSFPSGSGDGSGGTDLWRTYLEYIKKDFSPIVRAVQQET